jgi:hypothetical protein
MNSTDINAEKIVYGNWKLNRLMMVTYLSFR